MNPAPTCTADILLGPSSKPAPVAPEPAPVAQVPEGPEAPARRTNRRYIIRMVL